MANALSVLLNPRSIAVVGASPTRDRARILLQNLRTAGYAGEVYAINPRYEDVLGYKCYASIADLPKAADCLVALVGAEAACTALEQAFASGTRAGVVPSAGFGEGGHGADRAARLQRLAAGGMSVCGPNCFGLLSVNSGAAMYSGGVSFPLRPGPVALVSQSGGLGHNAFSPLMNHRFLGFGYVVSCGNASVTAVEDYVSHFVDDPEIEVIACIIESLTKPQVLLDAAQRARARRKSIVMFQPGRSTAGREMVRSHTGALVRDNAVLAAFLRQCGIVQVESYDTFVETIELFAMVPRDDALGQDVIVVSGSGGGAAVAADALESAGVALAPLAASVVERIGATLPEFGSVNNPLDGTGSIYDDPAMLPALMNAILDNPGNSVIACAVSASANSPQMRRFAGIFADVARTSGRTVVAYQPSPLGAALNPDIVGTLNAGGVPLLLGISEAMAALERLLVRQRLWTRAQPASAAGAERAAGALPADFIGLRAALVGAGVPIVATHFAASERDAVAAAREVGFPVAVKAEAPGLLHKSDIGCVRLGCASDEAVAEAYRSVVAKAGAAGFAGAGVLVQPMRSGVAEAFAGVVCDPLFGPAVVFGLGGIFVETLKDTVTEMAPLSHADALDMLARIKGASILKGARGRPCADLDALAALLVGLGDFALCHTGRFAAIDLNPIIVGAEGEGAFAVDIAVE